MATAQKSTVSIGTVHSPVQPSRCYVMKLPTSDMAAVGERKPAAVTAWHKCKLPVCVCLCVCVGRGGELFVVLCDIWIDL